MFESDSHASDHVSTNENASLEQDASSQESTSPDSKPSVASRLVNLALENFDIGVSEDFEVFALARDGARIARQLRGGRTSVRAALSAAMFAAEGYVPHSAALADAVTVLEGMGQQLDPVSLHLRTAFADDHVYIDLGTADGQAIVVTPERWHVTRDAPVIFRRSELTAPMPTPEPVFVPDLLWRHLNVSTGDRALVWAWLVSALLSQQPTPVLAFVGEQGSGKSSAARILVELVDPSPAPLRRPPTSEDGWPVLAHGSWAIALDNILGIKPWFSDQLCRTVTGDGDVRRRLYADNQLVRFQYSRPLILNGIDLGEVRGDLSERLLTCQLERINPDSRRTDETLRAAWTQDQPRLLGTLLTLISRVLRRLPETHLEQMPRMADFARVLACVDAELGTSGLATYLAQSEARSREQTAVDPVALALSVAVDTPRQFRSADLLRLLTSSLPEGRPPLGWPSRPQALTTWLRRNAPMLRDSGWGIDEVKDGHLKVAMWHLTPPSENVAEDPWTDGGDDDAIEDAGDLPTHYPVRHAQPPTTRVVAGYAEYEEADFASTASHYIGGAAGSQMDSWCDFVEIELPRYQATAWRTQDTGELVLLGQATLSEKPPADAAVARAVWTVLAAVDPEGGHAVLMVDDGYPTIDVALAEFESSIDDWLAWEYQPDGLDAVLPWLRHIEGCPL